MYASFTEWDDDPIDCEKRGTIHYNGHYHTHRKPVWLVGLKVLGLAAMVAVGFEIALPSLRGHMEFWQAVTLISGVMFIYTGIAFFVRPEPDGDNMGWLGGLMNDPTQYSDDVNRRLWTLHCVLGPGRFAAETLLDTCLLVGLARRDEVEDPLPVMEQAEAPFGPQLYSPSAQEPIAVVSDEPQPSPSLDDDGIPALNPSRFARRRSC